VGCRLALGVGDTTELCCRCRAGKAERGRESGESIFSPSNEFPQRIIIILDQYRQLDFHFENGETEEVDRDVAANELTC
jgi:hypothetical protein